MIEIMGVDLAENVFQRHGVARRGHVALKRRVMRAWAWRSSSPSSHVPVRSTVGPPAIRELTTVAPAPFVHRRISLAAAAASGQPAVDAAIQV